MDEFYVSVAFPNPLLLIECWQYFMRQLFYRYTTIHIRISRQEHEVIEPNFDKTVELFCHLCWCPHNTGKWESLMFSGKRFDLLFGRRTVAGDHRGTT